MAGVSGPRRPVRHLINGPIGERVMVAPSSGCGREGGRAKAGGARDKGGPIRVVLERGPRMTELHRAGVAVLPAREVIRRAAMAVAVVSEESGQLVTRWLAVAGAVRDVVDPRAIRRPVAVLEVGPARMPAADRGIQLEAVVAKGAPVPVVGAAAIRRRTVAAVAVAIRGQPVVRDVGRETIGATPRQAAAAEVGLAAVSGDRAVTRPAAAGAAEAGREVLPGDRADTLRRAAAAKAALVAAGQAGIHRRGMVEVGPAAGTGPQVTEGRRVLVRVGSDPVAIRDQAAAVDAQVDIRRVTVAGPVRTEVARGREGMG